MPVVRETGTQLFFLQQLVWILVFQFVRKFRVTEYGFDFIEITERDCYIVF